MLPKQGPAGGRTLPPPDRHVYNVHAVPADSADRRMAPDQHNVNLYPSSRPARLTVRTL